MFVAACMFFVATKTSVFRCGQNWFDQHRLYLWRDYLSLCICHSVDEQQSSKGRNTGKTGKQKPRENASHQFKRSLVYLTTEQTCDQVMRSSGRTIVSMLQKWWGSGEGG